MMFDESDLTSLKRSINLLDSKGAREFDPVRFQFIESLYRRAEHARPKLSHILRAKTQQALSEYQDQFEPPHPPHKTTYNAPDAKPGKAENRHSLLTELTRRLDQHANKPTPDASGLAFDAFLQAQEQNALAALSLKASEAHASKGNSSEGNAVGDAADGSIKHKINHRVDTAANNKQNTAIINKPDTSSMAELKSTRLLKQEKLKEKADDLVNEAIAGAPQNPGPLNPQMLTIRALSHMRDLSPYYLSRFVSYIDTLFWLEEAGSQLEAGKRKKGSSKNRR
jgi:hypothetical protein